jgi:hypothetical protein
VPDPAIGQPPPLEAPGTPDEVLPETPGTSSAPDDAEAIGTARRKAGYWLGALTIGVIGKLGWWSLDELHAMKVPDTWIQEKFAFAVIAGHAVITVALIYFLYQVLRIAERLVLPYWWVDKDPSPVRTMLGVRDPVSTMMKMTRDIATAVRTVMLKK